MTASLENSAGYVDTQDVPRKAAWNIASQNILSGAVYSVNSSFFLFGCSAIYVAAEEDRCLWYQKNKIYTQELCLSCCCTSLFLTQTIRINTVKTQDDMTRGRGGGVAIIWETRNVSMDLKAGQISKALKQTVLSRSVKVLELCPIAKCSTPFSKPEL